MHIISNIVSIFKVHWGLIILDDHKWPRVMYQIAIESNDLWAR